VGTGTIRPIDNAAGSPWTSFVDTRAPMMEADHVASCA